MKIVLGAAGFIGFHLTSALLETGEDVIAVDNFDATLYSPRIKRERAELLASRGLAISEVSLEDFSWIDIVEDDDVIFNLAATAGLTKSWLSPSKYLENNTLLVARMLEKFMHKDTRPTIVQASTSSVYGEYARADVNQPPSPTSPYGASKLAAEQLLRSYSENYGFKTQILRLFSVYGPHQRPDQFFALALRKIRLDEEIQIFGDGNNSRTNVNVHDAVQAFLLAQDSEALSSTTDISGLEEKSVLEILEALSDLYGKKARVKFIARRLGDQRHTKGDIQPAKETFGWEPKVPFDVGVRELVEHFVANPSFYSE
jgi:nucleoside-diphosphate-sugar epimerase